MARLYSVADPSLQMGFASSRACMHLPCLNGAMLFPSQSRRVGRETAMMWMGARGGGPLREVRHASLSP